MIRMNINVKIEIELTEQFKQGNLSEAKEFIQLPAQGNQPHLQQVDIWPRTAERAESILQAEALAQEVSALQGSSLFRSNPQLSECNDAPKQSQPQV